jgi:hypothetical protein
MKNLKYLLVIIVALATTFSCVEDEVLVDNSGPVVAAEVKINEVMSTGDPDWVELYNAGSQAIDLTGYALKDSSTKWTIPNVSIPAGGYIAFDCDGLDTNGTTNFKISSGGESITLFNPADDIIDEIMTPDMAAQIGLTYGREVDGGDVWVVQSPSKGIANSNVNSAPVINAEPLTEFDNLYTVTVSDAGGVASVKLVFMINDGVQSIDMALVEGEYKTSVPQANVGDTVQYYIVATDNTGLTTYYPENGNNVPASFTVVGGIDELEIVGENAGYRGEVTFTAYPYYPEQVDEIRLYYLLPSELQDDVNDEKTKVVLTQDGDTFVGVVPAQNSEDVISYYLRVEYIDGTQTYYPIENGGDFDHDFGTTWPSYTIEAIVYDEVVETTVNSTEGPLTSLTFSTNPVPGTDINLVLAYTSSEEILEARVYFSVGDSPFYLKANKVSGEDDASFTQTGVTINLKDVVTDGDALLLSGSGAKVSFYVRIATATAEYYYSNTGAMSLDDTPGGGTTDESDAFKADTTLWNVYNVQ